MNIKDALIKLLVEAKEKTDRAERKYEEAPPIDIKIYGKEDSAFCKHNKTINRFAQESPENLATTLIFVIATQLRTWPAVIERFTPLMSYIYMNDGWYPEGKKPGERIEFSEKEKRDLSLIVGKGDARDSIHYIWKSREKLFTNLRPLLQDYNNAQNLVDREAAATKIYDELLGTPQLGLPKAGFATQLLIGKYGCIDSINLQLLPKIDSRLYKTSGSKPGFVSVKKVQDEEGIYRIAQKSDDPLNPGVGSLYIKYMKELEEMLGGKGADISQILWDAWCDIVAHKIKFPTGKFKVGGIYEPKDSDKKAAEIASSYGKESSEEFARKQGEPSGEMVSAQHGGAIISPRSPKVPLLTPEDPEYERLKKSIKLEMLKKFIRNNKTNAPISEQKNMKTKIKSIILEELLKLLNEKTFAGKKELDNDGDGVPKWADKDDANPKIGSKSSKKKELDEMSSMSAGSVEGYAAPLDEEDDTIVEYLTEEEAKKNPPLGKVTRNPAGSNKKFHVYVKCNGKVKKISFGDPGLSIKRDSPERRKNFRARHKCDKPEGKNRCTARYWSCYQWRAGKKVEGE